MPKAGKVKGQQSTGFIPKYSTFLLLPVFVKK